MFFERDASTQTLTTVASDNNDKHRKLIQYMYTYIDSEYRCIHRIDEQTIDDDDDERRATTQSDT